MFTSDAGLANPFGKQAQANNPFILGGINKVQATQGSQQAKEAEPVVTGVDGTKDKRSNMVELPKGHGSGCGHCTAMQGGLVSKDKLEAMKQASYNKIMQHEQAHKSTAGDLGGSIHIDFDSNGFAVGGHVPIKMPSVNPENPEKAVEQAKRVQDAALAPGDPSGQDFAVAARAAQIESKAQAKAAEKEQQTGKKTTTAV